MLILFAVHIFFTVKTRFVQRYVLRGIKYSLFPCKNGSGIGTYKAFASALGTTIGAGNITGVAVAIATGGAGSILWMWLSGIVAMSTKYVESYLSIRYAVKKDDKKIGGTGALLQYLGHKKTAVFWTVMCAAGGLLMGSAVPASSLADILPADSALTGLVLAALVALTVSFGLGGIATVCSLVVPLMSVSFIGFCIFLLLREPLQTVRAVKTIFCDALNPFALGGGALGVAVREGITRGLYSNESGLGTGGVMAAEAGDDNVKMSALAAMTTVFWDTVVMCAMTGVVFVSYGGEKGMQPGRIMSLAFENLPLGKAFLCISMSLFVFATVIGWYYIAKRALSLFVKNSALYDFLYITSAFFGATTLRGFVWKAADAVNLLVLVPSVYVLIKFMRKISLHK